MPNSAKSVKVSLIEATTIPARKGRFIEASLDQELPAGAEVVFEPKVNALQSYGLSSPESILSVNANGNLLIPLQNFRQNSTNLEAGMELGTIERFDGQVESPECKQSTCAHVTMQSKQKLALAQSHNLTDRQTLLKSELKLSQRTLACEAKQVELLEDLLLNSVDVFALNDSELGRTSLVKHSIDTGDHPPIKQQPRRTPFVRREKISKLIDEIQQSGVMQPSASAWASPIVIVPKKDGTSRFCVDFRRVNAVTKKDVYPLPRIDDILDTLGGAQYFSTLDLSSGYWQIELDPVTRDKTAFTSHYGLYEFIRMPFGLCNAPATFQRLMQVVLRGIEGKFCFVYIDDILVCSKTFEEHLKHLEQVFERLNKAGLTLKPKKCCFLRKEVLYLGHVISGKDIAPDPAKTQKIHGYPVPTDLTKLRQFLGLASYYRRFIPGFAKVAHPLYQLMKKGVSFEWDSACQTAFNTLKNMLTTTPVLVYPQFGSDAQFILETDASSFGLGAVLAQKQKDG